ncbi:MAG: VWA domain-containing protein [Acidobacteriota bacterium]
MERRRLLQTLLAASAIPWPARSDQSQPDFTLRSDVRLVMLEVSVRNRRGGLVSGLAKENFTIFENGLRQEPTVFTHEDLPVTVGLLVDESFSMRTRRAEVISAAEVFIAESNRRDEIFVLNFNDRVGRGLPEGVLFSDDPHQLRAALHRGKPQGKTALNDALVQGLKQLKLGVREKKAIVLISDGGDNASAHSKRETLRETERSAATIYAIGLYDEGDQDRNPGFLQQLAAISGGEAYFPLKTEEMPAVCRRIAKDIRARYTLGYVPAASDTSGNLRHIRVRVTAKDGEKLAVRARTSYLYGDDAAKKS